MCVLRLLMRSCELSAYIYVWEHYRQIELPWDSAWTWWISFLGVDFCYYWVHRFSHGIPNNTHVHTHYLLFARVMRTYCQIHFWLRVGLHRTCSLGQGCKILIGWFLILTLVGLSLFHHLQRLCCHHVLPEDLRKYYGSNDLASLSDPNALSASCSLGTWVDLTYQFFCGHPMGTAT